MRRGGIHAHVVRKVHDARRLQGFRVEGDGKRGCRKRHVLIVQPRHVDAGVVRRLWVEEAHYPPKDRHARIRGELGPGDLALVEGFPPTARLNEPVPVFDGAPSHPERVQHRVPVEPVVVLLIANLELRGTVANERPGHPARDLPFNGERRNVNLPVETFKSAAIIVHGGCGMTGDFALRRCTRPPLSRSTGFSRFF
jgi:hypothetical protein